MLNGINSNIQKFFAHQNFDNFFISINVNIYKIKRKFLDLENFRKYNYKPNLVYLKFILTVAVDRRTDGGIHDGLFAFR